MISIGYLYSPDKDGENHRCDSHARHLAEQSHGRDSSRC